MIAINLFTLSINSSCFQKSKLSQLILIIFGIYSKSSAKACKIRNILIERIIQKNKIQAKDFKEIISL